MHLILHAIFQIVEVARAETMDQKSHATNVEGCLFPRDSGLEDIASIGGFADKFRDEEDCLHSRRVGGTFCDPSSSIVDTDLDASVDGRCDIIRMTLWIGIESIRICFA